MKKQGFGEKHAKPLFFRDLITEMPRLNRNGVNHGDFKNTLMRLQLHILASA
jgi:hypothetical protein